MWNEDRHADQPRAKAEAMDLSVGACGLFTIRSISPLPGTHPTSANKLERDRRRVSHSSSHTIATSRLQRETPLTFDILSNNFQRLYLIDSSFSDGYHGPGLRSSWHLGGMKIYCEPFD